MRIAFFEKIVGIHENTAFLLIIHDLEEEFKGKFALASKMIWMILE